jgi:ParB family transcriptional regulator, chromosome partitioning protein
MRGTFCPDSQPRPSQKRIASFLRSGRPLGAGCLRKTRWTSSVIFASLPNLNPSLWTYTALDRDVPAMPVIADKDVSATSAIANGSVAKRVFALNPTRLKPSGFSQTIYGDPAAETDGLLESIRDHGILVPLVVAREPDAKTWEVVSGHRRLACALALDLPRVPCEVRTFPSGTSCRLAVLEYNRQRQKNFSQMMREADALEELWKSQAKSRRLANLRRGQFDQLPGPEVTDRLVSDDRRGNSSDVRSDENYQDEKDRGRTDLRIAQRLGIGGKDLYRQARAVWRSAQSGDVRAQSGVAQLDDGTKTIHAAYKDLRRRGRFSADFRPTPYDVWSFRHDRAFGIPHAGSIPAAIIAHTLYYYTQPDALVVDPMAGGGSTLDVCQSMGRRCLVYDIHPVRLEIIAHDIRRGFPAEASHCDLIFCDPPYHTMLANRYSSDGIAAAPLAEWTRFLTDLARNAFAALKPGGYFALLLGAQTEKDLPAGFGYLDHAFLGYSASLHAGFQPERRISCPMEGAYTPQQVRRARQDGRLLGQVRDLLVVRKPVQIREIDPIFFCTCKDGRL